MKRIVYASAFALLVLTAGVAVAQDPDLGAVARQTRAKKKPSAKKVYTNDDIASQPQPEPAAAAPDANADAKSADGKTDAKADAKDKPKTSAADEQKKAAEEMQAKVDSLKKEIATLQREYDIADRENKLQVANYYADAGNSLRDPKKFQDEQRATQAELADKKKAIDDNKAKLADLVEQARKAGIKVNE